MREDRFKSIEEFSEAVKSYFTAKYPDYRVFIEKVTKNNGVILTSLIIMKNSISPTIYLNDFYTDYIRGASFDAVLLRINSIYASNADTYNFKIPDIKCYVEVVNKLFIKVINRERNSELLKKVPHIDFLDLSAVIYVLLGSTDEGISSTIVKNEMLTYWNVEDEELFKVAYNNSNILFPLEICSMRKILESYGVKYPYCDEIDMYIASNNKRLNGAAAIMYKELFDEFCIQHSLNSVYIIPSSINELILLPIDDDINPTAIQLIIREVNRENVSEEEFLSDNLYIYNKRTKKIEIV